jgi:hypothetical protein
VKQLKDVGVVRLAPYLAVYINDHRAGAAAGVALSNRCLRSNQGTPLGAVLQTVTADIEADEQTLHRVADVLGIARSPLKELVALAAERIGRLKPNGQLGGGYTPLARLLELEALQAGISAKRLLWVALAQAELPPLAPFDFDDLQRRADSQLDLLAPHHADAARAALADFGRNGA